ncbi:hypothetical protein [Rariglobus hedericola]|uniref:Uncharacterized protein n=1 Tax=Rariglobus hedericola TaxID=2597822 RepID=A0A556QP30_9BACT|nr:hypothetical protein [Rariglobus hedericola]TSJ78391.1 hypothetical protein FPL22_03560 [Rariglobus hedericola]
MDAQGNFPITRTLIALLAFAVALFNQALFWLLAVLIHGQGRPVPAGRFLVASLGLGVALWLILLVLQFRFTGAGRRNDSLIMFFTGTLLIAGLIVTSPGFALAATVAFTAWATRGLKK